MEQPSNVSSYATIPSWSVEELPLIRNVLAGKTLAQQHLATLPRSLILSTLCCKIYGIPRITLSLLLALVLASAAGITPQNYPTGRPFAGMKTNLLEL
jgi:hypothetical protein